MHFIQCLNCQGVWGLNPPTVISIPLTHCQMHWGLAIYYMHTIYITILVGLWQSKSSTPDSSPSQQNVSKYLKSVLFIWQWRRTCLEEQRDNCPPPSPTKKGCLIPLVVLCAPCIWCKNIPHCVPKNVTLCMVHIFAKFSKILSLPHTLYNWQ